MPWLSWIHEIGLAYLVSKNLICVIHKTFLAGCDMCERIWTCLNCNEVRYGDDNLNIGRDCETCEPT